MAGTPEQENFMTNRTSDTDANTETKKRDRQSGFTMIELLVVMVILGLLAALVAPNVFKFGVKGRISAAKSQISSLATALDALALDTGRYPSAQEGLRALLDAPQGMDMWDGPYLKKLPRDPWGHDYVYRGPQGGQDYEILSYGADGSPGGEGDNSDISNLN
jgi:general secretion pathway protein G